MTRTRAIYYGTGNEGAEGWKEFNIRHCRPLNAGIMILVKEQNESGMFSVPIIIDCIERDLQFPFSKFALRRKGLSCVEIRFMCGGGDQTLINVEPDGGMRVMKCRMGKYQRFGESSPEGRKRGKAHKKGINNDN